MAFIKFALICVLPIGKKFKEIVAELQCINYLEWTWQECPFSDSLLSLMHIIEDIS